MRDSLVKGGVGETGKGEGVGGMLGGRPGHVVS